MEAVIEPWKQDIDQPGAAVHVFPLETHSGACEVFFRQLLAWARGHRPASGGRAHAAGLDTEWTQGQRSGSIRVAMIQIAVPAAKLCALVRTAKMVTRTTLTSCSRTTAPLSVRDEKLKGRGVAPANRLVHRL